MTIFTLLDGNIAERTRWHRVVRKAARRWLDYRICEYKKYQQKWTWAIDNIQRELNLMFTYNPVPMRRDVLEKYVYRFLSNDKLKWKTYWLENNYMKHPDMPNKAWEILSIYWHSLEGQANNFSMKEKRTLMGQKKGTESISSQSLDPSGKRTRGEFDNLDQSASDLENHHFSDENPDDEEPVS